MKKNRFVTQRAPSRRITGIYLDTESSDFFQKRSLRAEKRGKIIAEPSYGIISKFKYGTAIVAEDGEWVEDRRLHKRRGGYTIYFDRNGYTGNDDRDYNELIRREQEGKTYRDGKYGVVDQNGKILILARYDDMNRWNRDASVYCKTGYGENNPGMGISSFRSNTPKSAPSPTPKDGPSCTKAIR